MLAPPCCGRCGAAPLFAAKALHSYFLLFNTA